MAIDATDIQALSPEIREKLYTGAIPSPTSRYFMNLRFIRVNDPNTHLHADVDIGPEVEDMLEDAYAIRFPDEKTQMDPTNLKGFQGMTRIALTSGMLMDLNIWPFALTLLASIGDDTAVKVIEDHRRRIVPIVDKVVNTATPESIRTRKPKRDNSLFN